MLNMNKNEYSGAIHDNVFDKKVLEFSEICQNIENLSLPEKVDITRNCENLRAVDQAAENINVFGENEASKIGEQIDVFDQKVLEFSENCQNIENLFSPEKLKIDENMQIMQNLNYSEDSAKAEKLTKTVTALAVQRKLCEPLHLGYSERQLLRQAYGPFNEKAMIARYKALLAFHKAYERCTQIAQAPLSTTRTL